MIGATTFLLGALFLLVGIFIGAWSYRTFFLDQRSRGLEQQLDALTKEQAAYRAAVASHFDRSASLINQLTDSYQEVHEHLRHGAQALCGQPTNLSARPSDPT